MNEWTKKWMNESLTTVSTFIAIIVVETNEIRSPLLKLKSVESYFQWIIEQYWTSI